MIIREVMKRVDLFIDENTSIDDAKSIMKQNGLKILPVIKDGRYAGIVSDDLLKKIFPIPASRSFFNKKFLLMADLTVENLINESPFSVSSNTPVIDALKLAKDVGCDEFPVVDDGKLVGIANGSEIISEIFYRYI